MAGTVPDKRLALHAYEQILDMIMSGRLKPGTVLQERRICEMLDMSRTPVRDAMLVLEGEGLLMRNEGRALQVRFMDISDFIENLAVRSLLEPEAVRLSIGRIPAEQLAAIRQDLKNLLEQAQQPGAVPDRVDVRSIDDRLHGAISSAARNRHLESTIRMLRQQTKMFDLRSLPTRLEQTCKEHIDIVDALLENRADDAVEAMRSHLNAVRQSIIKHLGGA
jgi:DNA-binding GntR family transcriptional regulator